MNVATSSSPTKASSICNRNNKDTSNNKSNDDEKEVMAYNTRGNSKRRKATAVANAKKKKKIKSANAARQSKRRSRRSTQSQIQSLAMALTEIVSPSKLKYNHGNNHYKKDKRRRSINNSNNAKNANKNKDNDKKIVLITGAGLSVKSGIQPFRGKDGVWSQTLWTNATRDAFRKDPLGFYNDFWLRYFAFTTTTTTTTTAKSSSSSSKDQTITTTNTVQSSSSSSSLKSPQHKPNEGHEAIAKLCNLFPNNMRVITQNIDGLHSNTVEPWDYENKLVECHGRIGLFKCLPDEDSDTSEDETDDSDSDSDSDSSSSDDDSDGGEQNYAHKVRPKYKRLVKLGSFRKTRQWKEKYNQHTKAKTTQEQYMTTSRMRRSNSSYNSYNSYNRDDNDDGDSYQQKKKKKKHPPCWFEMEDSIPCSSILPLRTRQILSGHDDNTTPTTQNNHNEDNDTNSLDFISSNKKRTNSSSRHLQLKASSSSMSEVDEVDEVATVSTDSTSSSGSEKEHDSDGSCSSNSKDKSKKQDQQQKQCFPTIKTPPKCPNCSRPIAPQALLFDEAYHSHSYYQFQKMEEWISNAAIVIFVGTSFAVNITESALDYARDYGVPVWNLNIEGGDFLEGRGRLDVENLLGDVSETLPALYDACRLAMDSGERSGIGTDTDDNPKVGKR